MFAMQNIISYVEDDGHFEHHCFLQYQDKIHQICLRAQDCKANSWKQIM